MRKAKSVFGLLVFLLVLNLAASVRLKVLGQEQSPLAQLDRVLLREGELKGYSLKYQREHSLGSRMGIIQGFVSPQGQEIWITYADFDIVREALNGARNHIGNVAAVFREGSFTGARIGDKSWISGDSILFVQNSVLVLVSASSGGEDHGSVIKTSLEATAVNLAQRIASSGNSGHAMQENREVILLSREAGNTGATGARFIRGDSRLRISWHLRPSGSLKGASDETIFLHSYDFQRESLSEHSERIRFSNTARTDASGPPMPMGSRFSLIALPAVDEFILAGLMPSHESTWAVYSTHVVRNRNKDTAAETRKAPVSDYVVSNPRALWSKAVSFLQTSQSSKGESRVDIGRSPAVCDMRVAEGKKKVYMCGTTASAEAWYSTSKDEGVTWETAAPIRSGFAHPSIIELLDGRLMVFGVEMKALWSGERSPDCKYLTGTLHKLETDWSGKWSEPSYTPVCLREDILAPSACMDDKGRIYVAFDCYPQGTPVISRSPQSPRGGMAKASSIHVTYSTNQGGSWSKPVQITSGEFQDADPDIAVLDERLMVTFTRHEGNASSVYAALLTAREIGLPGSIGRRLLTLREQERAQKDATQKQKAERRSEVEKAVLRLKQPPAEIDGKDTEKREAYNEDMYERNKALLVIMNYGDATDVPILLEHTGEKYELVVRATAIRALGQVGDAKVIPFLERFLASCGSEEWLNALRRHCSEAITKIRKRTQ